MATDAAAKSPAPIDGNNELEFEWSLPQLKMIVLVTASVFIVISGALVGNQQLYYMAALLLVLPIVSYLVGVVAIRGVHLQRDPQPAAWEGETITLGLSIEGTGGIPRLFLKAKDDLPKWLEHREDPVTFHLTPGTTTRVAYDVRLGKRGAYKLTSVTISATDPLGIFTFMKRLPAPGELLVYPRIDAVPDNLVAGKERYGFRDMPLQGIRGSGVDPDGVRGYVPGDPLRRMHWRSVARTGKLHVIEFEESRSANIGIVVDLQRGCNYGAGSAATFERLVRVAAGMAQAAIRQGSSVQLITSRDSNVAEAPSRGSEHLFTILASLARTEPNEPSHLADVLDEKLAQLQPGTSVALLTSSVSTTIQRPLAQLAASGCQAIVLFADPEEFAEAGQPVPTASERQQFFEAVLGAGASLTMVGPSTLSQFNLDRKVG